MTSEWTERLRTGASPGAWCGGGDRGHSQPRQPLLNCGAWGGGGFGGPGAGKGRPPWGTGVRGRASREGQCVGSLRSPVGLQLRRNGRAGPTGLRGLGPRAGASQAEGFPGSHGEAGSSSCGPLADPACLQLPLWAQGPQGPERGSRRPEATQQPRGRLHTSRCHSVGFQAPLRAENLLEGRRWLWRVLSGEGTGRPGPSNGAGP